MASTFILSMLVFLVVVFVALWRNAKLTPWLWLAFGFGCVLQGAMGLAGIMHSETVFLWTLPNVPVLGNWGFQLDELANILFALMGVIGLAASLVAAQHARYKSPGTGRKIVLIVSLQYIFTAFLLTATNAIPLLIGWETMSLCAYTYILVNHRFSHVRRAAFVTLFVSELGFLLLVLAVVLAAPQNGNFDFTAMSQHLRHGSVGLRDGVLLLAVFGFGTKSGVFPTQLWMPDAYDATPSHLAAILAGGLLNLGVFGILRFVTIGVVFSLWVGIMIVLIGAIAVLFGALFAVIEEKMRRLLAYSSIENVGFMMISLGLALTFSATHNPKFAAIALTALFVQMVSHAVAKALAFLAAGEIGRTIGSTNLRDVGGLFRVIPGITLALLVSSLTLAAVAPFSGFASEWLTLQTMLQVYRSLPAFSQILIALAGLATATGAALGLTAFLRLFVFAMTGRLRNVSLLARVRNRGKEPGVGIGLGILAILSAIYGWFPTAFLPLYERVIATLPPFLTPLNNVVPNVFGDTRGNQTLVSLGASLFSFVPLRGFVMQPGALVASIAPTYLLCWFIVFGLLAAALAKLARNRPYSRRSVPAWLGGKETQARSAQYTASAYANPYRMFWSGLLHYRLTRVVSAGSQDAPQKLVVTQTVTSWLTADSLSAPLRLIRRRISKIRIIQHGYLWGYLLVMLLALGLLILWGIWPLI